MLNKSRRMFVNITVLTGTSLLIRLIAFSFQVWLVERVGSEGIGLFGLVMSVSAFASTLAISGVSYAAVRYVFSFTEFKTFYLVSLAMYKFSPFGHLPEGGCL